MALAIEHLRVTLAVRYISYLSLHRIVGFFGLSLMLKNGR